MNQEMKEIKEIIENIKNSNQNKKYSKKENETIKRKHEIEKKDIDNFGDII